MTFLSDIAPNLIATAIGLIIGGVMVYFFFPRAKEYFNEKGENERKILELIGARGAVSQTDVEKYLAVPPEEAAKELDELEHRGVIRQTYKSGESGIFYESTTKKK